jgi:hypothetical protein
MLNDNAAALRRRAQEYRQLAFTSSRVTAENLLGMAPRLEAAADVLEEESRRIDRKLRRRMH